MSPCRIRRSRYLDNVPSFKNQYGAVKKRNSILWSAWFFFSRSVFLYLFFIDPSGGFPFVLWRWLPITLLICISIYLIVFLLLSFPLMQLLCESLLLEVLGLSITFFG